MFDLAKLRICFLAGTLGQGGAERQLFYILKALKLCGVNPRLFCFTRGEFWENPIRDLDVPITWVGQRQSRLARLSRILQLLRKYRPDVVQSQHFFTNLYAVIAANLFGLHEVGAMRTDALRETKELGILGELSLRFPRFVAVNSRAAIQNAVNLSGKPSHFYYLPNVVDTDHFIPVSHRPKKNIKIILVGRLIQLKRVDRFLSILARVNIELPKQEVKGIVAGDGPMRKRLEQQAMKMGLLPDVIDFRGSVANVNTIYQEGDIFVLTSDTEGTPNVILEAMASGLPVVATDVGGVPEIVQHTQTGFLSDPGNEDAMVEALSKLVSEPKLRIDMGGRARAYVEAHHSLEQLPIFLQGLYEAVLS